MKKLIIIFAVLAVAVYFLKVSFAAEHPGEHPGTPAKAEQAEHPGITAEHPGAEHPGEKAMLSGEQIIKGIKEHINKITKENNAVYLYAEVLREFVDDGKVDYAALKNNHSTLDKFLKEVAELDNGALNYMPQNEKIAFYINVYNALALKLIIDHYPMRSIRDIPGVWDKVKFIVAERKLTLNQIEHDILRKEFMEPRIHFTLVCASKGCPELAREPFSGEDLYKQINREAHKFINDKTKVRLDKDSNILYLSSIFKWFKEDFGDIIKFISSYLPKDDVKFIKEIKPKIRYLNYDWSLNEKL